VSHLIVSCRECGAAVGAACTYVEQRRKGQPLACGHRIRQAEAEGWRTSEETARDIADWLESPDGKRDLGLQGVDRVHVERYARAIRDGAWRRVERAESPEGPGEAVT
jgi:hypothetical protein